MSQAARGILFGGGVPMPAGFMQNVANAGWYALANWCGPSAAASGIQFSPGASSNTWGATTSSGYTSSTTSGPYQAMNQAAQIIQTAHQMTPPLKMLPGLPNWFVFGHWGDINQHGQPTNSAVWTPLNAWPAYFMGSWNGAQFTNLPSQGRTGYTGYVDPGADGTNTSAGSGAGTTWQDWYAGIADYGDGLNFVKADGVYLDAEDVTVWNNPQAYPGYFWAHNGNAWGGTYSAATHPGSAGLVASLAQEQAWAYLGGKYMMYYLNNGRTDLHTANGNKYDMHIYMPNSGGHVCQVDGAWTVAQQYANGPLHVDTPASNAGATATWAVGAQNSTFLWMVAGMASEANHVYIYDSTFYATNLLGGVGGPFTGSTLAQQIASAYQYDISFMQNANTIMSNVPQWCPDYPTKSGVPGGVFTMPSNVSLAPMLWLDGASGQQQPWSTAQWGQFVQGIQSTGIVGGDYSSFQFSGDVDYSGYAAVSPMNFSVNDISGGITHVQDSPPSTVAGAPASFALTLPNQPIQGDLLTIVICGQWYNGANGASGTPAYYPSTAAATNAGVISWTQVNLGANDDNSKAMLFYGTVGSNPSNSKSVTIGVAQGVATPPGGLAGQQGSSAQQSVLSEWSGITGFDQYKGGGNEGGISSINIGTALTPSNGNNELIIALFAGYPSGPTAVLPSPWTTLGNPPMTVDGHGSPVTTVTSGVNGTNGSSSPGGDTLPGFGAWQITSSTIPATLGVNFPSPNDFGQASVVAFAGGNAATVAPGTPTLNPVVFNGGEATLTWTPGSGGAPSSYTIIQTGYASQNISVSGATTTHTVQGLVNGQSYTFGVQAVNNIGTSAESITYTGTPTITRPGQPLSLTATSGNTEVILNWQPPADGTGTPPDTYTIIQTGYASQNITLVPGTATSYPVTGLVNNQSYTFGIEGITAAGAGPESTTASATPAAVISHVQNTSPSTAVASSWPLMFNSAPAFGDLVTVLIGGGSGAVAPTFTVSGAGVSSWTYQTETASLCTATIAYGVVTANPNSNAVVTVNVTSGDVTGGEQSVASEWQNFSGFDVGTSATGTGTTAAPGSLTPTGGGTDLFLVVYGTTEHFNGGPVGWTTIGQPYDSGIDGWINSSGTLNPSVSLGASVPWVATMVGLTASGGGPPPTVPNAPTITSAGGTGSTANLVWSAPVGGDPATGYTIVQTGYASQNINVGNVLSYPVQNLHNGSTYTFGIVAYNGAGAGPESVTANVTLALQPPGVPALTQAIAVSPTEIDLTWTAPAPFTGGDPTSYTILWTDTTTQQFGSSVASGLTAPLTGLTPGNSYTVGVEAVNSAGNSAESNTMSVTLPVVVGPPALTAVSPLGLWSAVSSGVPPAPASGLITLQQSAATVTTTALADITVTLTGATKANNWVVIVFGGYYNGGGGGLPYVAPLTGASGAGVGSWTALRHSGGSGYTSSIFYGQVTGTPGTSIVLNVDSSEITNTQTIASEWNGFSTTPFDASVSANASSPGIFTPAGNGELLIVAYGTTASISAGPASPWTTLGTTGHDGLGSYLIQTTATSANPVVTTTGSATAIMAAFKP